MARLITEGELTKIIAEEVEIIREAGVYYGAIHAESVRLLSEGRSVQLVNEGIVGMLASIIGHAPSGVVDMFKAKLIRRAQEGLGFNPESLLGRVVANVIEAIKLSQLPDYFGPNKCDMLADMVLDGIAETLVEVPGDRIALSFGFNPQGVMWPTFRESITNSLLDENGIGGRLKETIKGYVCNVSFSDIMSGMKSGTEKVTGGVGRMVGGGEAAAAAVPAYGRSS